MPFSVVVVDNQGHISFDFLSRSELAIQTKIKPRDLRLIDPSISETSSIAVQNNSILLNMLVMHIARKPFSVTYLQKKKTNKSESESNHHTSKGLSLRLCWQRKEAFIPQKDTKENPKN